MAYKTRQTSDPKTGLALERGTGIAPASDHNYLAGLRQRDGHLLIDLTGSGIIAAASDRCTFNQTTKRITTPGSSAPLKALMQGMYIEMGSECAESGTIDSATTTSLIDTGLEAASDNYWQYAWIVFTSGANNGLVRQCTGFTAASSQLTWTTALPTAPSAGDTFEVTFFYVEELTNGDTNYIYMTTGSATTHYGIAAFYANVTGTPDDADDLLVATAVLNAGGTCTSVNNSPSGVDKYLYPIVGHYDNDVQSVTNHGAIAPAGTVTYYATHDQMASVAGLEVAFSGTSPAAAAASFTFTILEHYEDDRVRLTITNGSSYSTPVTVTVTRKGVKLVTL